MASFIGGDLVSISANHPTLGNFNFATKSGESYTLDPGGHRSDDDEGMVTGAGEFVDKISRVRWSFEGPIVADFSSNNEIVNLPALAESSELATWTFTHISGTTWRGRGKFVGSLSIDTLTTQFTVKIAGGGILESL